jgi:hypothetical protein
VLNEFDVCIKEPAPEMAVVTPVAELVIEVTCAVCPDDPTLKVLEGSEPPMLIVFEEVDMSEIEFAVGDNVLATFILLTEIRVPVDVAPEFVIRDAELD